MANLLLFTNSFGQNDRTTTFTTQANDYFNDVVNKLEIPGFSIVVVKDGEIILNKGYGYANVEKNVKTSQNTNYYIASATKPFTALLASILDNEGIIKLDDSLDKFFPELEFGSELNFKKITVRDLLTHTSGLDNGPIKWRLAFSGEHDLSKLIDLMKYSSANNVGHGNYKYTNAGYNIYAIILEKVTGKSWKDWMQEKIFNPIGMNNTSAYISRAVNKNWELAKPYAQLDSLVKLPLEKKDNTMQSAGGLISTSGDLGLWLKVQLQKGKLNDKNIISQELINNTQQELVKTPSSKSVFKPTNYGMGWQFGTYLNEKVIHHFGGFVGFSTHISFMPKSNIGIAVMINEAVVGYELMNLIACQVYDYFLIPDKPFEEYYNELNVVSENANKIRSKLANNLLKRKSRKWLLSKKYSEYSGEYFSDEYGTIHITGHSKGLKVVMGNLQCEATPYINKESTRIELVPGRGQVINFVIKKDKVIGLKHNTVLFSKR